MFNRDVVVRRTWWIACGFTWASVSASGCAAPSSRHAGFAETNSPFRESRLAVRFARADSGEDVVCAWRLFDESGFVVDEGVGARLERRVERGRWTVEAGPAFGAAGGEEVRRTFLVEEADAGAIAEETIELGPGDPDVGES